MLSDTLEQGLRAYDIGAKIRALRLKRSMGLVALGGHTGLSPALLSKIERGRLHPTLPTLLRIALVFSVGLDYFFAGARDAPLVAIVRRADRLRFPDRPGAEAPAYRFESLDFPVTERRLNAYFAEFFPVPEDQLRRHAHQGVELIYVLRGTLAVQAGDETYALRAGDSMYFDSGVPHGYRRKSRTACHAVVITTG
jgi:quercetin dioxygenase-like cupin family protein/DNA-binding XRE family transcriptional regulator